MNRLWLPKSKESEQGSKEITKMQFVSAQYISTLKNLKEKKSPHWKEAVHCLGQSFWGVMTTSSSVFAQQLAV